MRNIRNGLTGILLLSGLLSGCTGVPDGVTPVSDFDINRYVGTWYEIARLDHRFERDMDFVTAEYRLREDGGIDVTNRGFIKQEAGWKSAHGKAYLIDEPDQGYLKVSFFGPVFASYVIFELDHDGYQYAFVTSHDKSYLWLLSRTPQVSDDVIQRFEHQAEELGYPVDELIYVDQYPEPSTVKI